MTMQIIIATLSIALISKLKCSIIRVKFQNWSNKKCEAVGVLWIKFIEKKRKQIRKMFASLL